MITEDYVSFETAKLLKEKEFNYPCQVVYSPKGIVKHYLKEEVYTHHLKGHKKLCPTLQMAMKWLREIYGYVIVVEPGLSEDKYVWTYKVIFYRTRTILLQHEDNVGSSTYEETCEAAIKYCLENLI